MKNYAAILLTIISILTASAKFASAQKIADSYFANEVRNSKPVASKQKAAASKNLTAPANDNFADSINIVFQNNASTAGAIGNNISGSKEANEPNHAENNGGSSVWFKFTPTVSQGYEIRTTGDETNFDTTLAVYTGNDLQSLSTVGYNDDCYESQCGTKSRVRLQLAAGTTYYIAVDGYNNGVSTASGSFYLIIAASATAFDEDNIASAYNLGMAGAGSIAGTNFKATGQPGEPGHAGSGVNGGKSVWYRFQTLKNRAMTFEIKDDFGSEMAVYSSFTSNPTFAQLLKLDSVRDYLGSDITKNQVNFLAETGVYYFIVIDWSDSAGNQPQTGNFQLKFFQTKLGYSMRLDDSHPVTSVTIFRPSEASWYSLERYYLNPNTQADYLQFGLNGDKPIPADFDGDAITNCAVTRNQNGFKNWYVKHYNNQNIYEQFQWGLANDMELVGDFDRDGRADATVIRNQNGNHVWYVRQSSDLSMRAFVFGLADDRPVLGDFDGDGATEVTVVREAAAGLVWYILKSNGNQSYTQVHIQQFGIITDQPVAEDYDGDGKTDISVFRPSTGNWYILRSSDGQVQTTHWGASSDRPQPGDYDSDGKADLAVYRPSTGDWYFLLSSNNAQKVIHWGTQFDKPVSSMARFSE